MSNSIYEGKFFSQLPEYYRTAVVSILLRGTYYKQPKDQISGIATFTCNVGNGRSGEHFPVFFDYGNPTSCKGGNINAKYNSLFVTEEAREKQAKIFNGNELTDETVVNICLKEFLERYGTNGVQDKAASGNCGLIVSNFQDFVKTACEHDSQTFTPEMREVSEKFVEIIKQHYIEKTRNPISSEDDKKKQIMTEK